MHFQLGDLCKKSLSNVIWMTNYFAFAWSRDIWTADPFWSHNVRLQNGTLRQKNRLLLADEWMNHTEPVMSKAYCKTTRHQLILPNTMTDSIDLTVAACCFMHVQRPHCLHVSHLRYEWLRLNTDQQWFISTHVNAVTSLCCTICSWGNWVFLKNTETRKDHHLFGFHSGQRTFGLETSIIRSVKLQRPG